MEPGDERRIDVTVLGSLFRSEDGRFSVVRVRPDSGGEALVAAGAFPLALEEGDALGLTGRMEHHPKHGLRFNVRTAEPRTPAGVRAVTRWLAGARIPGVGKTLAERMVEHLGEEALTRIEEDASALDGVPGIGPERAERIVAAVRAAKEGREAALFLAGLDLPRPVAQALHQRLGDALPTTLAKDPYALVGNVRGFGFKRADQVAQRLGLQPEAEARRIAALCAAVEAATESGHVALPLEEAIERAALLAELPQASLAQAVPGALNSGRLALARATLPSWADPSPWLLYPPALLHLEERLADALLSRVEAEEEGGVLPLEEATQPHGHATHGELRLSPEQAAGVATLMASPLAVLTGGPGVGKTTVLRQAVRAAEARGWEVALAAPTGRAARRLAEATGREATTVHRLVGFGASEANAAPIEADVVVVDEVSMLDLPLAHRLLTALPAHAHLWLVGDPDQLPSVGPGSVLADLLASRRFPVARLTRVFRQAEASLIVTGAHRILKGESPLFARGSEGSGDAWFIGREDAEAAAELLVELMTKRLPQRFGLDARRDIQVLSPMRRGPVGTEALNERLQAAFAAGRPAARVAGRNFVVGDRVMQIRNDAERELANGEIGVIEAVDPARTTLRVRFEERVLEIAGASQIAQIVLAWAITVHKSQGAEYPAVLLPLTGEHRLMLRRQLLYTAFTRAKRLLVVTGRAEALDRAVADARGIARHGSLRERLMGHPLPRYQADDPALLARLDPHGGPPNTEEIRDR